MGRRRRSYNYGFSDRSHSGKGIAGFLISLCSIGAGVGLILYSFSKDGAGSLSLAMGGFVAFFVAVVGFGLAVDSLRQEERRKSFPVLALIFSILALAGWIGIYVLGFIF